MSLCVFDHDTVCTNESAPNVYGKRCIEADNLLKTEQTLCKYHYEGQALFNSKKSDTVTAQMDNVRHPSHYCQGGIECIMAIEASMTPEEFQGYCKGNVMKYVWRFREKNGLEDLKKAQVYLGWMIESKEKQEQSTH